MNDAELMASWGLVTDPRTALGQLIEHSQFVGSDPYYRDLDTALWEMATRSFATPAPGPTWVLITVEDGDIETTYYGKDMQAETTAYQMLMSRWPDDEPKPDNFEEAYDASREWSSIDMRIEQCPSS